MRGFSLHPRVSDPMGRLLATGDDSSEREGGVETDEQATDD